MSDIFGGCSRQPLPVPISKPFALPSVTLRRLFEARVRQASSPSSRHGWSRTDAGDGTALARFVDDGDPAGIPDPEAVLNALRSVKVCEPACGSGAYLLGMMQELHRQGLQNPCNCE